MNRKYDYSKIKKVSKIPTLELKVSTKEKNKKKKTKRKEVKQSTKARNRYVMVTH